VVKNYPKSPKAPDAMYKVGVIMQVKATLQKPKRFISRWLRNSRVQTAPNKRKNV
jgi:hypothetical protein